jgi:putative endonuclease
MTPGWSVYVLWCGDGTYYTGITNDLMRRLAAHRAGQAMTRRQKRTLIRDSRGCER